MKRSTGLLLVALLAGSGCPPAPKGAADPAKPPEPSRPVREISDAVLKTRDRCLTCHTPNGGIDQAQEGTEPFRFHSPVLRKAHPTDSYGCAVCHGGTPLATDKATAHTGESPLLLGVEVQARCARCHSGAKVEGTEVLQAGLNLLEVRACFACHDTPLGEPREHIAPAFEGLADKVKPGWLPSWLLEPRKHSPWARMPHFYLSQAESLAIAAHLTSLTGPGVVSAEEARLRPTDGTPADARELIRRSACLDCHRIGRRGGSKDLGAPDLSSIGRKVKLTWLVSWLQNPRHFESDTPMPSFRFTKPESRLLASYLLNLDPEPLPNQLPPAASTPELRAKGKEIVERMGCLGCHAPAADRPKTKMGPDLTRIGDRKPTEIFWGNIQLRPGMDLADYLRIKITQPRAITGHERMPNFGFQPDEVRSLVVALLSFSEHSKDRTKGIAEARLAKPKGLGGELVERFSCFTCHALRGRLGKIAPDLGWQGDKSRREWLVAYLKEPYDLRPALAAEMPAFGLTDAEANALADVMAESWTDPAVPDDPFGGEPPPAALVEQGRELFWEEYECQECHMLEGKGETECPPLDGVGDRLRPGWLYQWMLNPETFYDAGMPDQGLSEEEAKAVTAYLLTLRGQPAKAGEKSD